MSRRLSAREITIGALSLIGRFTPNDTAPEGHDVLRGLDWLDDVLSTFMAKRWIVQLLSPRRVTLTLVAGKDEYELSKLCGPVDGIAFVLTSTLIQGEVRSPFDLLRLTEFTERRDRAETGLPCFGHLDRSDALRLRVWPVPPEGTTTTIEFEVCSYPPTVAATPNKSDRNTGNMPIGLRPEWNLWAKYALAFHLGNGPIVHIPAGESDKLFKLAEKYEADLQAFVEQEMPTSAPVAHFYDPYGTPGVMTYPRY